MHSVMHSWAAAIVRPISVIPVCFLQHSLPKYPLALPEGVLMHVKTQEYLTQRTL